VPLQPKAFETAPIPLPGLRVRTLGAFQVWQGEEAIAQERWSRRKVAALFKVLLGAPGHQLHREQVADLLWPEGEAEQAANSLSVTIHLLRRVLDRPGQAGSHLRTEGALVALTPALEAEPDAAWWDAAAFERAATAALAGEDIAACRAALAGYGGEYLPEDRYEGWAGDRREHLQQRHLALLLHLASLCGRQGEVGEAEATLRAVLATEAGHERAGRALMRLLGEQGRRAEALRVYEALATALRMELGVAPGPKTEALRTAMLAPEAPAPEAPREPEPALALPSGTLTFLLTDIEGSTTLWDRHPAAMRAALVRHDAILDQLLAQHQGRQVKERGEGDSIFAVFTSPTQALAAVCALQQALLAEAWPGEASLRVRMGLHSGEADLREGGYYGSTVNRTARIRSLGHGGQVLLSQTTADLVRDVLPEGVGLRALGTHQLTGLERPEPVWQLLHPALPAAFPPLRSPQAPTHNLPVPTSSFIGREGAMAAVGEALAATRLLTLVGAGGCGKTRLALAVAGELVDAYPEGVWLVELAALSDAALVVGAVATALGVREEPARPLLATLADYLQGKELLLVLDNCEHLVGACAALAEALLRGSAGLSVLATSREGLGVAGERIWRVPSLALADPQRLPPLDRLAEYEAVRLFCERGHSVRSGFALTEQNAWAVVLVCRRLDGLPLAIELAAARLGMLSVEQIAARLDDRFKLLTGGARTALPRQQTLRAALDWNWDLLEERERVLLRRLSVFAGGWTLAAAEAACVGTGVEEADVLDWLGHLVDKSLAQLSEACGEVRYNLLETVRAYAQERLTEAGEEEAVREQHLACFLALTEQARPKLTGPEQGAWLARLEREHENLRVALRWSIREQPDVRGLQLAGTLWPFWSLRGHFGEGRAWLEQSLATHTVVAAALRATALRGAGTLASAQGDYPAARAWLEESLALCRELDDKVGMGYILIQMGHVMLNLGEYSEAWTQYEGSLALFRELGDKRGMGSALLDLGNVARHKGDFSGASTQYEGSLTLFRDLGDQSGTAKALDSLGNVALDLGDYTKAQTLQEESLALFHELGLKADMSVTLINVGEVLWHQGHLPAAKARYEESLALCRELGDKEGIGFALGSLGNVALDQGDHGAARARYIASLTLRQELGDMRGVAKCLEGLAGVAGALGQAEHAAVLCGAAEALREVIGAPLPPSERGRYARSRDTARAELGEEAFLVAWSLGQTMDLEEVVASVLEMARPAIH
jgi:predicted ATPase/class 3 adenylate cyclase